MDLFLGCDEHYSHSKIPIHYMGAPELLCLGSQTSQFVSQERP